ncbi:hypothetical protein HDU86_001462 [Geranomyces michiganensis]|nr:hypothetical protein HDU86_001462 [Geranomyces michiganensis]
MKKAFQRLFGSSGARAPTKFEDNYLVGKQLGIGTFAVVRECLRKSDGAKFAVKIIDKRSLGKLDTLRTELTVLHRLSHANIISLHEAFETPSHVHIVTDLATGGELFDRILAKGSFVEQDASRLVREILLGVAYLHGQNIVHRDLKPENLLFRGPQDDANLMIADFGLAKVLDEGAFLQTACGTPHYVAPEILRQSGHGKAVDMWAIGVITYVLLCGYTPFYEGEQQSNAALFQAILQCEYEFDRAYWSEISQDAKDFIRSLLVVDPTRRATVQQALQHPWLETTESNANLLPALQKAFDAKRAFKRAVLAINTITRATKAAATPSSSITGLLAEMQSHDSEATPAAEKIALAG